jgi:hypothetical protein
MKHSIPLFLLSVTMMVGCKPQVPSEYIQPDDLEDILYEYHVAEAMARNGSSMDADYNQTKYFQAVLEKHHVTEAVFDSSLVYYYSHAEHLKEIYSDVYERLVNDAKKLGASVGDINRYSQYSETGDTANIWRDETAMLLIPRPTKNRFDFVIDADSTFMVGDSFMFQFVAEHIWQSGSKDAVVCIKTTYEKDSVLQSVNHVSISGITQLRVPYNKTHKIKELRGFIYLPQGEEDVETRRLMFISQIQLIRFHNKDIQEQYENDSTEVVKTDDSLQRIDITGGPAKDTLRNNIGTGLRSKNAPFRRGGASNGVAAGPDRIKKAE